MTETQEVVTMAFGAVVAVAGIALMLFGRSESSQNRVKFLGMEFEISTPALAVFLVGSGLFVLPHFLPRTVSPPAGQITPSRLPIAAPAEHATEQVSGLAHRPTRFQDVVATIKRFDDRGGLLTLEMEVVNESPAPPPASTLDPVISLQSAVLLDESSRASWRATQTGGRYFAWQFGGDQRRTIWAKFDLGSRRPEVLTLTADFLESPWENLSPNWASETSK